MVGPSIPGGQISRRQLLKVGAAAGAAMTIGQSLLARASATPAEGQGVSSVDHVVFLIQENRSFDHYFGTLSGVRGFSDHNKEKLGVFSQVWPRAPAHLPPGRLLPFHLDSTRAPGQCVRDITHAWEAQHRCWNRGTMDRFVAVHSAEDGSGAGPATMGYYRRKDLPFYYALADAFTICDGYHCSVMGPTDPNRLYSLSGTIDPEGKAGGPVVENPTQGTSAGLLSWTTMPERLQSRRVSWKVYQFPPTGLSADTSNNMLPLFKQYHDPASPLFQNGLLPTFPGQFQADVLAGDLPQVSWVLSPPEFDEHPAGPVSYGEYITAQVLNALMSNPRVWSKAVLFVTYDENGGFFDHLPPPTAPPGTAGEYLTSSRLPSAAARISGPIGLGFRVPMLVVSPFSRGGWVCSDTFDHTSMLRFLETRFGVEVPNLSEWRRSATGDLTSTLDLRHPDATVPPLPDTTKPGLSATAECATVFEDMLTGANSPTYPVPTRQTMPTQEPGSRRHRP
jgi:phospholipase C